MITRAGRVPARTKEDQCRQIVVPVERPTALRLVVLIALSLIAAACEDDKATDASADTAWGPLAVLNGPPSGDEALIAGSLQIGDDCVTLEEAGGEMVLLVWPSDGTTWNPESRVIEYSDGDRTVELSHGEEVAFGGGGDSVDEGGLSASEWIGSVDGWVSEPDRSCPASVRWFVGGLPPADAVGS